MTSLVAQIVKNLPAVQKTRVQYQGQEDPVEKEMAPHSSILPWEFYGWRSLAGYSPWVRKESDMTEWLTLQDIKLAREDPHQEWLNKENMNHFMYFKGETELL